MLKVNQSPSVREVRVTTPVTVAGARRSSRSSIMGGGYRESADEPAWRATPASREAWSESWDDLAREKVGEPASHRTWILPDCKKNPASVARRFSRRFETRRDRKSV